MGEAVEPMDAAALYRLGEKEMSTTGGDKKKGVTYLRKAAEQGHAKAQYELAWAYFVGKGVRTSVEKGIKWLQRAAENGHDSAQYHIACRYADGDGLPRSNEQAVYWFQKVTQKQCNNHDDKIYARAQFHLALHYACGAGVPKSTQEAERYFRKYVEWQRRSDPRLKLGELPNFSTQEWDDSKSLTHTGKMLSLVAKEGLAEAQYFLAQWYINIYCYTKAAQWFRKAALQGVAEAQYFLAHHYAEGRGLKRSYQRAATWFRKAATQGYVEAHFDLGMCYIKGDGVTQNLKKAIAHLRKAAEQNSTCAQFYLGLCYATGEGVKQSFGEAVTWFQKSISPTPHPRSSYVSFHNYVCTILGICYLKGIGVAQSNEHADRLLLRRDNGQALLSHGLRRFYGECTQKSDKGATHFFQEAARFFQIPNLFHVPKKYEYIADWFRRCVAYDYTTIRLLAAICVLKNEHVTQSKALIIAWLRQVARETRDFTIVLGHTYTLMINLYQAAVQAYFSAMLRLAKYYTREESFQETLQWCQTLDAQTGVCPTFDEGVQQILKDVADALRRAAERGDPIAQVCLGECYTNGSGVEQSEQEALKWFKRAAAQGDAKAKEMLAHYANATREALDASGTSS